MAILNYGNQFKYSGKGYVDSKMAPVHSFEDLEKNVGVLSSLYMPGMKVTVLNDGDFGAVDYFLNQNYEWKRVVNLESLTLSLDKGNYDADENEEKYLQIHYVNSDGELVALGEPVDLSVLFDGMETTNTFVVSAEIVTEMNDEKGLFIKYTYNDGNVFYTDITTLEPKVYTQGVGILIGKDNVINVNEEWFDVWFKRKISNIETQVKELTTKQESLSTLLNTISDKVSTHETEIKTINGTLTTALNRIGNVENKADYATKVAEEAKTLVQQVVESEVQGDNKTIAISDRKASVLISQKENNAIRINDDGVFVNKIVVNYMDSEINEYENGK